MLVYSPCRLARASIGSTQSLSLYHRRCNPRLATPFEMGQRDQIYALDKCRNSIIAVDRDEKYSCSRCLRHHVTDFFKDPTLLGSIAVYEQKLIDIGEYSEGEDELERRMVMEEKERKEIESQQEHECLIKQNEQLREKLTQLDAAKRKEHEDWKKLRMEKYTLKMGYELQKKMIDRQEQEIARFKRENADLKYWNGKAEDKDFVHLREEFAKIPREEEHLDMHTGCCLEISLLQRKIDNLKKELGLEREKSAAAEEIASKAVEEFKMMERKSIEERNELAGEIRRTREEKEWSRLAQELGIVL